MNGHAAARTLGHAWLDGVKASPQHTHLVLEDVVARLDDLPSALRLGACLADTVVAVVPRRARGWPVISEYVRLVHSLTAVSYFDVVTQEVALPRQRTQPVVTATSEPRT